MPDGTHLEVELVGSASADCNSVGEIVGLISNFYLSVAARKTVKYICP